MLGISAFLYNFSCFRIRKLYAPPLENCAHPRENEKRVQFFFLHECFGAIIPFEKPKIENPSHLNWINLQRDEHGNGMERIK